MAIEIRKPTDEEIEIAESWPTWVKEVSEFSWNYSEKESCLIIKGRAEVETSDGEKVEFEAGDFVVFPSGIKCVWKVIEPIEKKYNFS